MDLSFYKLRICDADLILIDDLDGGGRDRDWESVAQVLLHRRRGAGAERLAVISRAETELWLRVFRRDGEGGPIADAALCATRYLLDSGRTGADSVRLRVSALGPGGAVEVDVLDSASLGIAMGGARPLGEAGDQPGAALGAAELAALATSIEAEGCRYQVLPFRAGLPGADGVAVFAEGGSEKVRARIGSATRGKAPEAVAVRVISRGELAVSAQRAGAFDCCGAAAMALASAAAVGYSEREALVRFGGDGLWVEWTSRSWLYAAGRPEYVYRGEFHLSTETQAS